MSVAVLHLENRHCRVTIAPAIGGRLTSLQFRDARGDHEVLWRNAALPLRVCAPGTAYDPEFYGGVDEMLPCDLVEVIDGVACPDHGELWTTALRAEEDSDGCRLWGTLALFGLAYERRMRLASDRAELICDYTLINCGTAPRHFMWKLHAALAVQPGDVIECPALKALPVDPANTTCPTMDGFQWPMCSGVDKSRIPAANGSCEFLYLHTLTEGRMGWRSPARDLRFTYHFDRRVFPYAWLFQSFGGFDGHYTTILEPCTCMPIAVNAAAALNQCTFLPPGARLTTTVRIVLGHADTLESAS